MAEPKWLTLARKEIGTKEWPGSASNPKVMQYYIDAVGVRQADAVPWCMAFVNAMLERSGYKGTKSLMARSALNWGERLFYPKAGAIVVFGRGKPPSGHVGFVADIKGGTLYVLGGNQSDAVNIKPRSMSGVLGYRWPKEAA